MLDDRFKVSDDGAHIIVPGLWSGAEPVFVPVSLLVEMKKVGLYPTYWQDVLRVLSNGVVNDEGKFTPAEIVPIEQLVGVDLVGKTVSIFYANWEDSEWLATTSAVTVDKEGDGSYRFNFGVHSEEWDAGYPEDSEVEETPYDVSRFLGMSFSAGESVTIHVS